MHPLFRDPTYNRYLKRFIPASVIYAGAIVLASMLIPDHAKASPLTIGIALLPGLACTAMIWAMARLLVEMEEVEGESVDRGSRRASRRERGAEFCSRACEGILDDLLGATAIKPFILLSAPILASPVRKRACGYRFEPR